LKKSEAIITVNNFLGEKTLNSQNTNFSKVNISKPVWWFNIPPKRFMNDLHLILLKEKGFIWIKIPGKRFKNLEKEFRIRQDKNVVDLEISAEPGYYYLRDIKSGGTGIGFEQFVVNIFD
jgi:hypothetical protein